MASSVAVTEDAIMNEHKNRVTSRFGESAADYATSEVHAQGESLGVLLELTRPRNEWQMLDVGTGAGHTAIAFAPHVSSVIASDLTPGMLKQAEALAAARGITNVTTQLADAEALPFEDASFDFVTCRMAFHHFQQPESALSEMARVLKPNGALGFTDNYTVGDAPSADFYNRYEIIRDPSHFRVGSLSQLRAQMTSHGFNITAERQLSKEFEFHAWADRQRVSDDDKAELMQMMRDIPDALRVLMQPRFAARTMYFLLGEVVFVASANPP